MAFALGPRGVRWPLTGMLDRRMRLSMCASSATSVSAACACVRMIWFAPNCAEGRGGGNRLASLR
eukprot:1654724-Pyramimonas_sp.AAC.1